MKLYAERSPQSVDRRAFVGYFSTLGLGTTLLPGVLWAKVQDGQEITKEILAQAEKIAGLSFEDDERELMLEGLNEYLENYAELRSVPIPNWVSPAIRFDPAVAVSPPRTPQRPVRYSHQSDRLPSSETEVAFLPVGRLSRLIRTRRISSLELTRLYLDRLKRHGDRLECVISVTEELALEQARRADREISRGVYRSPLHGIPWGAKDLLATREHLTTWGARPYEEQNLEENATIVRKLEEAGAVLVGKLTLGALAWGDVWFGGKTRNPWNLEQGSSGSSAGSAAATVAGLVGFSIGSETLGSIVSPSTRCGATGLRPTFGRVSRYGSMALSWTMDKLGPICRAAEDCAMVFDAIRGPDQKDPTAVEAPFNWDVRTDVRRLRVGYLASAFERDYDSKEFDAQVLAVLRSLGIELVPVELPGTFPVDALSIILVAEAAAAFDKLTRSDRDELLVRQIRNAWPNVFRQARMIPAVEYIQANRIRTMVMGDMEMALRGIDVFVAPSFAPNLLLTTNLTGHPTVVLPNGFNEEGLPVSISFVGQLYGEANTLAVAKAYQDATDFHLRHPPEFST